MKLPKLNVRLLNRIKKHLSAEPKRYDQSIWGERVEGEDAPACNTVGCIGGWAVFLSVPKREWPRWIKAGGGVPFMPNTYKGIAKKAQRLLGLTDQEATKLFQLGNQRYINGSAGVEEAARKINDLIADRAAFVEKW